MSKNTRVRKGTIQPQLLSPRQQKRAKYLREAMNCVHRDLDLCESLSSEDKRYLVEQIQLTIEICAIDYALIEQQSPLRALSNYRTRGKK